MVSAADGTDHLVQSLGKPRQSFLILMPIYRSGVVPATEAERERQAMGWSYSPLITEQVLQGLEVVDETMRLRLRDITEDSDEPLFYESAPDSAEAPEVHRRRSCGISTAVAGRSSWLRCRRLSSVWRCRLRRWCGWRGQG